MVGDRADLTMRVLRHQHVSRPELGQEGGAVAIHLEQDEVGGHTPRVQLLALGLGHEPEPVRGNVDTRLAMVTDGRLDAVVLARAGLLRLGREHQVTEVLDPLQVLPAPGQGALAIECRGADHQLVELLQVLEDPDARIAVTAERALLAALEAGCTAPVGALAEVVEGDAGGLEISLRAIVAATDGTVVLRQSLVGPADDPTGLGRRLAALLLEDGAAELVDRSTTAVHPSTDQHLPERAS